MRPSVLAAFLPFTQRFEGALPYLYLDILGYVTTAFGNLADPVSRAQAMPFKNPDGSASSADQIAAAWNAVDAERSDPKGQKQTSGLAIHYGQAFAGVTTIRLDADGIRAVAEDQLAADEQQLRAYFPGWDHLPADAQLGILSMAWAMGAGFPAQFTAFRAAINAGNFLAADAASEFRGTGVAPRIAADHILFRNAAAVVQQGLDPSVLYYPHALSPDSGGGEFEAAAGGGALGALFALAFLWWTRRYG